MYKCHESYCLPLHLVCDGVIHCVDGDDEIGCDHPCYKNGVLLQHAMYKCRSSDVCISQTERCDGIYHCPHLDDEMYCFGNSGFQQCKIHLDNVLCIKPQELTTLYNFPNIRHVTIPYWIFSEDASIVLPSILFLNSKIYV